MASEKITPGLFGKCDDAFDMRAIALLGIDRYPFQLPCDDAFDMRAIARFSYIGLAEESNV